MGANRLRHLQERIAVLARSRIAGAAALVLGVLGMGVSALWVVKELAANSAWPAGTDMEIYLRAAHDYALGRNLYLGDDGDFFRYAYPPLFAGVLALLAALLGDAGAAAVWTIASAAALIAAIAWMARRVGVRVPWVWIIFLCGVVFFARTARADLYHGQVNFALLGLLVAGFAAWRANRGVLASALWAIMICFKPFLGVVTLFQLKQGDWRGAARTFVFSGVVFGLSFLPLYQDIVGAFWGWRGTTQHSASPEWAVNPLNHSFFGMFLRAFVENEYSQAWMHAPVMVGVGVALVAAIALFAIVFMPAPKKEEESAIAMLRLGAVLAAIMSIGPLTEGDHLYFVFPGVAAAWILTWRRIEAGAQAVGLWLATSAAWAGVLVLPLYPKRGLLHFMDETTRRFLEGPGVLLSAWPAIFMLAAAVLTVSALRAESGVKSGR
ncbi:MAG: DUF2029 domain-containing protein [Hyphomonadaceae bacterium]|nr:DUF2029 domain-containing protein [Hyphomonadaceae bacterium]